MYNFVTGAQVFGLVQSALATIDGTGRVRLSSVFTPRATLGDFKGSVRKRNLSMSMMVDILKLNEHKGPEAGYKIDPVTPRGNAGDNSHAHLVHITPI